MKAVITIYENGNKVMVNKKSFDISDEAELEQESEDIKDYLIGQLYEIEERAIV